VFKGSSGRPDFPFDLIPTISMWHIYYAYTWNIKLGESNQKIWWNIVVFSFAALSMNKLFQHGEKYNLTQRSRPQPWQLLVSLTKLHQIKWTYFFPSMSWHVGLDSIFRVWQSIEPYYISPIL
jgi:hypothetical protein